MSDLHEWMTATKVVFCFPEWKEYPQANIIFDKISEGVFRITVTNYKHPFKEKRLGFCGFSDNMITIEKARKIYELYIKYPIK